MADKKITKRERFEYAKEVVLAHPELFAKVPDMVEFIDHEIELLNRKGSKSGKETPAQKDSALVEEIIKDILAECEDERGMTVGAILKDARITSFIRYNGEKVSSQMITSIFTRNKTDFKNTVEKKVSYYALNYGVAETEVEGE